MDKARVEVSAEMTVLVRFSMEIEATASLIDTNKRGREAAERVAMNVVGSRGDSVSAAVQRITSFTTKLA